MTQPFHETSYVEAVVGHMHLILPSHVISEENMTVSCLQEQYCKSLFSHHHIGTLKAEDQTSLKKDLDEINDKQMRLEEAHNDLVSLLAEKMYLTGDMGPKISLESIFVKVQDTNINQTDKWLNDLQEGSKVFVEEYKVRDENLEHLDFEGEFRQLDPKKSLDVIVWFMMWVAKVYVRPEFIPEVCLILSRIWKVLDESQLNAQDLDNKLIWKRGMQECEELIAILPAFKNDKGLLKDFIQNVCQLIGKTFDEDDSSSESSYERV